MGAGTGLARLVAAAVLGKLSYGTIVVEWPDGTSQVYEGAEAGPTATLSVRDASAIRRAITGGGIGFAEGYMEGLWDTPDLLTLLDVAYTNLDATGVRTGPSVRRPLERIRHATRANSLAGAKENIEYHYDLGNDFYELWLDETMTYSSAMFEDGMADELGDAQRGKWDRLLELLQPDSRDHLLEIGCGWGGFALHAAKEAGCRVTGITLSQEQRDYAIEAIEAEGLEDMVDIRIQDYRQVEERFTGVASIEMFEAVGEKYWPAFFGSVARLLEPGRRAAIQTITICEASYERYRINPDFTQRYIFPGGMLPSLTRFRETAEAQGLSVGAPHFFGQSYARTLETWLERFDDSRDDVKAMGFDERFIRMWRYYLAYCRTGFDSGNVDVMQVALDR